jgi:endo-1,4-beta-D-glucanase Y/4-amino-4-deoxy-L-arabinose transferase-like glycosyltransferase
MAKTFVTRPPALAAPWRHAHTRLGTGIAERALLAALVLIALVAHGLNMHNNPGQAGLGDEGIYMSQAWAVLRQGRLAPYTYFYDHAPAGWIMLGAWMGLTGGPFTFGNAIDGGRVLMLLLHLAMVPMLFRLTRKLGAGAPAAALATLLFSLSPLAVFYQRLVLLDTIMLFWLLLSLNLVLDGHGRLSRFALSGICFGIAALSKETAIFLLPALLYLAWQQRREHHGRFALLGWTVPMAIVLSLYPLFATLKGELLPAGSSFAFFLFNITTGDQHVSLVEALTWQATRGGGGMLNLDNQFWRFVREDWTARDPLLFVGGALASVVNLLRGIRNRQALAAGLLGLLPLYYLGRGGVVLVFYVLFAIPFLCLNLALLADVALRRLARRAALPTTGALTLALLGGYAAAGTLAPLYTARPAEAARESVAWIKQNVSPESRIVTHDDPWTDLHEAGLGGPAFPYVHNHWKVAADPEIRGGVFKDDWRTVDYVLHLPGIEGIYEETENAVTIEALRNAHLVKRWERDGDVIELWKVNKAGPTEARLLAETDAAIAGRFERAGAFADAEGRVTSEAQSYAMLRAVWSGNRPAFERAWSWTSANLLGEHGLPAWLWQDGTVADAHTATDANADIALALLMAGKRWDDAALTQAGTAMVQAIWEREVVMVDGRPYLAAGDWATRGDVVALNPSYFAPYALRIFAEADPAHDWAGVIDTGYETLFAAASSALGGARSAGLPPDWVGLDRATGTLVPLALEQKDTTRYGYDAARTYWRVALDARWSGDGRATTFLQQAGFLRDEVERKGYVSAIYAHDGRIVESPPSMVGDAGALAALMTLEPAAAHRLYVARLAETTRDEHGVAWGQARDLYAQEWAWFMTALYADALPDLWHAQEEE